MKDLIVNPYIIAFIIVALAMIYSIFIRPLLVQRVTARHLTSDHLTLLDYACKKGVEYAEQLYKNDASLDRKALAFIYALDVIKKVGIIPEEYLSVIAGLIEANVLNLPKTHLI